MKNNSFCFHYLFILYPFSKFYYFFFIILLFLVADTQLYKRLCPSIHLLVRLLVRNDQVEKWKNERYRYFLCKFKCGVGVGVWMGVGYPCPLIRNDIVNPHHLLLN